MTTFTAALGEIISDPNLSKRVQSVEVERSTNEAYIFFEGRSALSMFGERSPRGRRPSLRVKARLEGDVLKVLSQTFLNALGKQNDRAVP
jgi:hypothetical protein